MPIGKFLSLKDFPPSVIVSSSPLKKEKSFTDLSKGILNESPSGFQNPNFEVEKNSKIEHLIPEIIISDLNATLETIPEGTGDETSEINSNDSNEILIENDVSKSEYKNIEKDSEKSDIMKIGVNIPCEERRCEKIGVSNPVFDYVTCEEQPADETPVANIKEISLSNTKSFERATPDEKLNLKISNGKLDDGEDNFEEENDLLGSEAKNKSENFESNGVTKSSIVNESTEQKLKQSEDAPIESENLKLSDIQQKLFTQTNVQKQPTENNIFDEKSEIVNKKSFPESVETFMINEEKHNDLENFPVDKNRTLAVLNRVSNIEAAKIEKKLEKTNTDNKGEPSNLESHKDKLPRIIEKQEEPKSINQFDPENHSYENPGLPEVGHDVEKEFSDKTVESKNKLDETLVLEAVKNQIEIEKAGEGDKERADNLIKIVNETVKTDIDRNEPFSEIDTRNKLDEDFQNEPEKVPGDSNNLSRTENTLSKPATKKKSAKRRNKKKR